MKKTFSVLLVLLFISDSIINAQPVPDSLYYKRLYYTGKVWGFLKCFHSEVAKGNKNWDEQLFIAFDKVKSDTSNDEFNNTLLALFDSAGNMVKSNFPAFPIPDSLKYNLNFDWFKDSIFLDTVISRLDTIRTWFRPQTNHYVGEAGPGGQPTFDNDDQFYQWGYDEFPSEQKRLLALFRYWNIINYFYPYKNLLDQNWDSTLIEFIPKMIDADNAKSFHLSFLELATRINDSHAFVYSEETNNVIVGNYFLPLTLKIVENQTVITGVFINNVNVKVGDVVKRINNISINTVRDSLRKYTIGSNMPTIERNINTRILRGKNEIVQLTIENVEGEKEVALSRNIIEANYYNIIANKGPIWKIIESNDKQFGYVDMGRFTVPQIESMFNDLWNTDAIIFDIRNYPNETVRPMIRFLFDQPIQNANISVPDISYPGTLYYVPSFVGTGDFEQTYRNSVFILFDENTQSQAEFTVMAFERHPNAVKIGSQTAGADGDVSIIYLPGGIYTKFTGLAVFYPDYTPTQRIGIVPDIEVLPTINGIREGRDEVLEAALNYNITDISQKEKIKIPVEFTLSQNYPNPFNPTTTIKYSIPQTNNPLLGGARGGLINVTLKIYDILGREVTTLLNNEVQKPGYYEIKWDASGFSSGVYFYRITAGDPSASSGQGYVETKKMTLLR